MNSKIFAYLSISFGGVISLGTMILYLSKTTPLQSNLPIEPGIFSSYGSFVGGVVGPFFALAGVLLLITSIAEQKDAFIKQQIESRFFQLLEIHRENSSQVQIKNRSGKKIFISMLRELYESYKVACSVCKKHLINQTDVPNIAYLAFFYGAVGDVSEEILRNHLSAKKYNNNFLDELFKQYKNRRTEIGDKKFDCKIFDGHQWTEIGGKKFDYKVFDGHQSRLGHYYRHLFQVVTYIDGQPKSVLNYREKYQYIKTLRAQLSTQEQLLFFWNSISDLGLAWEKDSNIILDNNKLITKYNIVKNIPEGYSKYVEVRDHYPLVDYEELQEKPAGRTELERIYF
jgi:hypothetical protein